MKYIMVKKNRIIPAEYCPCVIIGNMIGENNSSGWINSCRKAIHSLGNKNSLKIMPEQTNFDKIQSKTLKDNIDIIEKTTKRTLLNVLIHKESGDEEFESLDSPVRHSFYVDQSHVREATHSEEDKEDVCYGFHLTRSFSDNSDDDEDENRDVTLEIRRCCKEFDPKGKVMATISEIEVEEDIEQAEEKDIKPENNFEFNFALQMECQ